MRQSLSQPHVCAAYAKIRELLDQETIGRPAYLRAFSRNAAVLETGPDRHVADGFRDFLRSAKHGLTPEEMIHYFDVVRHLSAE